MTVAMVPASFRAGMITDRSRPELAGASIRLGLRRASRGKVRNGTSQGRAGRNSILLYLSGDDLKLLLQRIQLALDLGGILLCPEGGHPVLGKEGRDQRVGVANHRHGNTLVD